jgi:predicted nucleotidyltransferase
MNPVEGVFHDFVQLFEQLDVPYAVMGGLAVRAHGIPRPTYDVDLAILVDRQQLAVVIHEIRQLGYDVPEQYDKGWVDTVSGLPFIKAATFIEGRSLVADIFLAETDFLRCLISRRIRDTVNGFEAWLVTAEDLILLKLIANRPRDIADIVDILTMQLRLDDAYLHRWADILGVGNRLEGLRPDA